MNRFIFALPLLAACSNPAGIWLVQMAYDETAGVECEEDFSENFTDGYVPGDDTEPVDSEWTYEQSTTGSDTLGFAQIETTAAGQGVFIMGGDVLPGTLEKGVWTFSWTEDTGSEDSEEHEEGYRFTTFDATSSEIKVTLTFDGMDIATGEIKASMVDEEGWSESDEWGDEVAGYIGGTGQIPSSSYLVYDDGGDEYTQYNAMEDDDCDGDECSIRITTTCSGKNTFTATRTDFVDEDAYAHLQMP